MRTHTPLISIIVPIYNAEKFLRKCLDSISGQTYTNWEAILVNDGSLDHSGDICNEYAKHDSRFKVIHKTNGGVSSARQAGTENIKGDFFIHVDADDWMDSDMLDVLYQISIKANSDVTVCQFRIINNTNYKRVHSHNTSRKEILYQESHPNEITVKMLHGQLHGACWNKLIRTSIANEIQFYPSDISMCEDLLYNIRIMTKKPKIVVTEVPLYNYRIASDSLCSNISIKAYKSVQTVITELKKIKSINPKDLFNLKTMCLEYALLTGQINDLKSLYPEVHTQIIHKYQHYNPLSPLGSNLSLALKGHPVLAKDLLSINLMFLKLKNRIFK